MTRSVALVVTLCLAAATLVAAQMTAPVLRPSAVTTASGLKYDDVRVGKGVAAEKGRSIAVLYTGWLQSGRVFDSRTERNKPFEFILGGTKVIKGWEEGMIGMRVGGKRRLWVPSKLAYGVTGAPQSFIPKNADLTFEIELVRVGPKRVQ